MSRGRVLLIFVICSAVFWWVFFKQDRSPKNDSPVNSELESEADRINGESPAFDDETAPVESIYKESNSTAQTPAGNQNLIGIEREIRECLQDAEWVNKLSSEYDSLESLSNDLFRELKPVEVDSIVYKENTIKLPDGNLRVIRYEIGTNSEAESNNHLYWAKLDEEGFPIPVDLPSDITDSSDQGYAKLLAKGQVQKSSQTRLVRFLNEVEMSIVSSDGKTTAVSVQTLEHQIYCALDNTKGYSCDCPY